MVASIVITLLILPNPLNPLSKLREGIRFALALSVSPMGDCKLFPCDIYQIWRHWDPADDTGVPKSKNIKHMFVDFDTEMLGKVTTSCLDRPCFPAPRV